MESLGWACCQVALGSVAKERGLAKETGQASSSGPHLTRACPGPPCLSGCCLRGSQQPWPGEKVSILQVLQPEVTVVTFHTSLAR